MARIRSIKPEFWSSPGIETLKHGARLLYIAMWNWADDNGVGTANPRELLGFAFPFDDDVTLVEFRRMLDGIRRVFGVKFYTVAGRAYYSIPSWEKHQKFDRRSKGRHPGPDEADMPADQAKHQHSTESHESTSSARRDSVAGTGEQGNRGTGEEELLSIATRRTTETKKPNPYTEAFEAFWSVYPRKNGKGAAADAFAKATKRTPIDEVMAGARAFAADPNLPDEGRFVPLASTWLNQRRWDDGPLPARGTGRPGPRNADDRVADLIAIINEEQPERRAIG